MIATYPKIALLKLTNFYFIYINQITQRLFKSNDNNKIIVNNKKTRTVVAVTTTTTIIEES